MRERVIILGLGAVVVMGAALAAWSSSAPAVPVGVSQDAVAVGADEPLVTLYDAVSAEELAMMLDAGMELILIDLRVPEEPHIPGTVLVLSYEGIAASSELPDNLTLPIVVYGGDALQGKAAADALIAAGRENVYDLTGGIGAWTAAGYDLDDSKLLIN